MTDVISKHLRKGAAPASKTGNLLFEPQLRKYVIIYSFSVLFTVKSGMLVRYYLAYTIMLCTNVLPFITLWFWCTFLHFGLKPVNVAFVVDKVVLGEAFLRALQFYAITIMPPVLHPHISLAYY
jgi:hypothetical protein